MAPICKFWQQGNCRNGVNCRFEHPGSNPNPFGAPASNANRFGALSNFGGGGTGGGTGGTGGAGGAGGTGGGANQYKVTKESIKIDLADERPPWILSCYGPGKDAPEQLFGGYPREQSIEEVRLYVTSSANPQQALSEVQGLYRQAEQQIQTTINNLDGAVQFVLAAENKHPNRIDVCNQNTIQGGTNGIFARNSSQQGGFSANPFAAAASSSSSTTTGPSTNQNPFQSASQANPFASGGSGGGGTPAFGQPSALGQKPNPFASSSTPAFGQPSQMGTSAPAFGKPSQLGMAAPAFGQPSQMGLSGPAFGQPSTLGQKPNPFSTASTSATSGFGQMAAQNTQSPFGQPSTLGQKPNPFAAATPATVTHNPFGKPAATSNPFAQQNNTPADQSMSISAPPIQSNPFGQPSSGTSSGLATMAKNPFGQPAQSSPFGAPTVAATSNPFAQAQAQAQSQSQTQAQTQQLPAQATSPGSSQNSPYPPGSAKQHPPLASYTQRGLDGRLSVWMGQQVIYRWRVQDRYEEQRPQDETSSEQPVPGVRNLDGTWRKIIFPDGPPPYNRDTEPADPATEYTGAVRAIYARMASTGRFEGDIPEVPPMREDCAWVF